MNLFENNDFEDIINDWPVRSQPLDLVQEQRKDDSISEVISGLARGSPDQSPNLPIALRKYKQRLILEHDILYRLLTTVAKSNTNNSVFLNISHLSSIKTCFVKILNPP